MLARIAGSALTATETRQWAEELIRKYNRQPAECRLRPQMPLQQPLVVRASETGAGAGEPTAVTPSGTVIFQAPRETDTLVKFHIIYEISAVGRLASAPYSNVE